jgi:hypothetical protein
MPPRYEGKHKAAAYLTEAGLDLAARTVRRVRAAHAPVSATLRGRKGSPKNNHSV